MRLTKFLVVASIAFSVLVQIVNGMRPPRGDKKQGPKRKIDINMEGDMLKIVAMSKEADRKDKMIFRIKGTEKFAGAKMDYFFADKSTSDKGATVGSTSFELRVFKLIEFVPVDLSLGFQPTVDEVVQTFPQDNDHWTWADIERASGEGYETFTLKSQDETFELIGRVSGNGTNTLSPDAIKFDIAINSFPYQRNDSALALYCRVESDTDIKEIERKDQEAVPEGVVQDQQGEEVLPIELGGSGPKGKFGWIKYFRDQNGKNHTIRSRPDLSNSTKKSKGVYFTFSTLEQGDFLWDPELGVDYSDSEPQEGAGGEDDLSGQQRGTFSFLLVVLVFLLR